MPKQRDIANCLKKLAKDKKLMSDFKAFIKKQYSTGAFAGMDRPKNFANYNRLLNMISAYHNGLPVKQKRSGADAWDKYIKDDFLDFLKDRAINDYGNWFRDTYSQEFTPATTIIEFGDSRDRSSFDFRGAFSGEDTYHYIGALSSVVSGVPILIDCDDSGIVVGVGSSR